MKNFTPIPFLLLILSQLVLAADVKISQLPLGSAATTGINDSFPYVSATTTITRRLTLWDISNLPTLGTTYLHVDGSKALTANWNAGAFNITEKANVLSGTAGAGFLEFPAQSSNPAVPSSGYRLFADSSGRFSYIQFSDGFARIFTSVLTANRTYTWPDASTTIVGTGVTQILTNKTLTGNTAASLINGAGTININSTGTITVPSATDTLVGKATTDALTNKTWAIGSNTFTGQLAISNGGTGQATALAAFNALSPNSAKGNITVHNGTNNVAQAVGTNGFVLTADSAQSTGVKWAAAPGTAPTVQKFLSGSGTYTTPANVVWIRVRAVGGGGGGGGSTVSGGSGYGDGGGGTVTTFGASLLSAGGGSGGKALADGGGTPGGAGGTSSLGSGPVGIAAIGGGGGGATFTASGSAGGSGGVGGSSPLGGGGFGGAGTVLQAGGDGAANTGGGGGGAASAPNAGGGYGGSGGGSGGYVDAIITSPSASYAYAVGPGGTAGTAGTSGAAGGAGGTGMIEVEEHY